MSADLGTGSCSRHSPVEPTRLPRFARNDRGSGRLEAAAGMAASGLDGRCVVGRLDACFRRHPGDGRAWWKRAGMTEMGGHGRQGLSVGHTFGEWLFARTTGRRDGSSVVSLPGQNGFLAGGVARPRRRDCRASLAMTRGRALAMTKGRALAMTRGRALAMTKGRALVMTAGS